MAKRNLYVPLTENDRSAYCDAGRLKTGSVRLQARGSIRKATAPVRSNHRLSWASVTLLLIPFIAFSICACHPTSD